MNEEIPDAVKEYWQKLRQTFETECLELVKEERERTPEAPDYEKLGIMAVAVSKLLDRIDKVMVVTGTSTPTAPKKSVARLATTSLQKP